MLCDTRYDLVQILDEPVDEEETDENGNVTELDNFNYEKLYRHYSRFLLVVSELLVDFSDIAKFLDNSNTTKIFESESHISYSKLRAFINNVFKHKTKNLHKCNHHIPILFEDGIIHDYKTDSTDEKYFVKIGCSHKYGLKDVEYILVLPRLIEIIRLLIFCYNKIDDLMTDENIQIIAEEYGDKY